MTKILDGLFLGSQYEAKNAALIFKAGINWILCLDRRIEYVPFVGRSYRHLNDEITGEPINDDTRLHDAVVALTATIDNNLGPVLVHCAMGMNRTVAVVAAYLVSTHRANSIDGAIRFVESKGHLTHVGPNTLAQVKRMFDKSAL